MVYDDKAMISYVAVLPFVWQPYFDACWATMAPEIKAKTLVIDNTEHNIGIMKAHNHGLEFMKEQGADWLIVMSAALRFGSPGGLDFLQHIEDHPDHLIVNGSGRAVLDGIPRIMALGWHLSAFNKTVFEAVGNWDTNYTPYGFDDTDITVRLRKRFGLDYKNDTYSCDLSHASVSHSIQIAGVESPSTPRMRYFERKWGKHPGEWQKEVWDHPFNDPSKSLSYWPQPEDPLSIQNNEFITLGGDRNPT